MKNSICHLSLKGTHYAAVNFFFRIILFIFSNIAPETGTEVPNGSVVAPVDSPPKFSGGESGIIKRVGFEGPCMYFSIQFIYFEDSVTFFKTAWSF